MKFSDYRNYDDYVNSQTTYSLRRFRIKDIVYDYPKQLEVIPDENMKCKFIVTDHNGEIHTHEYDEDYEVKFDKEQGPVFSPWFFIEHGGKL